MRRCLLALAFVVVVLLAGCGGQEPAAPEAGGPSPETEALDARENGEQAQVPSPSPSYDLVGTPSDYSDPENWISIPEVVHEVDTLYLYPSCGCGPHDASPVVCDIDDARMRYEARYIFEDQASVFADATNVFAPFYRQIDLNAVVGSSGEEYEDLARRETRTDVYAMLDYYFENWNGGRPFILAGHSQGACLFKIALEEYFQTHPDYLDRMIAAYLVGWSVTERDLAGHPYLRFAEGADDTGVIVSWNTEAPENKGQFNFVLEDGAISINPLNWRRDETPAGFDENPGTRVWGGASGASTGYESVPGIADATLDLERGVVVSNAGPRFYSPGTIFGPASYHVYEFDLFYESFRQNVSDRIAAWQARGN